MPPEVLDRFLRYVAINTQSEHEQEPIPSTKRQFDLARLLVEELKELGLSDADVDEYCYVTATLPANSPAKKVLGFIAHMDTSPDAPAENIKSRIVRKYAGGDIVLTGDPEQIIPAEQLSKCIGEDIVTTDGTTLLGADDKSGVAAIMTAVSMMVKDPSIKHGTIKVGFTPDEEVGRGVDRFDVEHFGADVAYTLDGGELGEIEDENFNAYEANLRIKGYNVHPGYAHEKMINAVRAMGDYISMLPKDQAPETTKDWEGYIHPIMFSGDVGSIRLKMLIRDFTDEGSDEFQKVLEDNATRLREMYPGAEIDLEIKESYRNMKEQLDKHPGVVENAIKAIEAAGVKPLRKPIRGGTDGSRLSFMGLPTPNIFAGGINFHSVREFVPVGSMEKAVQVILNLVGLYLEE